MQTNKETRRVFLSQELDSITNFTGSFAYNAPGISAKLEVGSQWDHIIIYNFPLPDGYSPDYEDFLIAVPDYPEFPPAGVHVPSNSSQIKKLRDAMGGHVFSDREAQEYYSEYVEELGENWTWICFHYKDFRWRFNPNDIGKGDNLYKYIIALYANIWGKFNAV